jgi:DNA-binding LytR/AlgR family response regulator
MQGQEQALQEQEYLVFSNSKELVRISPDKLIYAQAEGNYTMLKLVNDKEHLLCINIGTVNEIIDEQLQHGQIIRIGKSLIINSNYIYSIDLSKQQLILSDADFKKFYELSASDKALKELKSVIESTIKHN